jgi:hypothetical protein
MAVTCVTNYDPAGTQWIIPRVGGGNNPPVETKPIQRGVKPVLVCPPDIMMSRYASPMGTMRNIAFHTDGCWAAVKNWLIAI